MPRTLVLGNGESRSHLNLTVLSKQFTIIGCNAIYRDIQVPHLVCCDRRMINEACSVIDTNQTKIYTRKKWKSMIKDIVLYDLPDLPYQGHLRQDKEDNWNSGPYAVLLSTSLPSDEIFLAGFDLYSTDGKVNNIYKDSLNYQKSNSPPVEPSYWIYQISKIFDIFADKKFIIINSADWTLPNPWKKNNTEFRNIEDFFIDNKYLSSIINE